MNLAIFDTRAAEHAPAPEGLFALERRFGGFHSLPEALDFAAGSLAGFRFHSARGAVEAELSYAALREASRSVARKLASLGLARGARVAVVAETGPDFIRVFFGCQYAGLVPCPMPYTMYIGGKDAYVARIAGMLDAARASVAIAPDELLDHVREAAATTDGVSVMSFAGIDRLAESAASTTPFGADDVAYIQYSSGSTSEPKGVLITQAALTANVDGILRHGLNIGPGDRAFSWLPLYHDMGLVGFCLAPMMSQVPVDYLATGAFARRPALWLKLMSENRSTIAYSPTFGYDLAARRINGEACSLDLSAWRIAGIGGDMVRREVLDLFAEKLSVAGFDSRAFLPSYGMAESTVAITFADLDRPVRVDTIDRAHAKLSRRAVPVDERTGNPDRLRSFIVCGRPIPGMTVEVRDGERRLGEREIGRLFVKGRSVMAGYYENPEATEAVLGADGFLDTGDMGYWLDGEIVITGRAKDLILHNGRNIWPQDLEWAAERAGDLRPGDAAAFAVEGDDGEDEVVVLVQCRSASAGEMEALSRDVAAAVHRSSGIECDIVLVPPRSLPFTSSGKLSRAGAKARFLAGEIVPVAAPERIAART